MPYDPSEQTDIRLVTLAQFSQAGSWQIELAHDRAYHLLIWITRGQGVALLDGSRRGIGTNNALFIPAQHLMALDTGRQGFGHGFGQALVIPPGSRLTLPESPQHLRIRDVSAQTELTQMFEAASREQGAQRPLFRSAMLAQAELMAIWLRRQMDDATLPTPRVTAARRLSRAYCARLVGRFASGLSMASHARALGVSPTHLTRACRAQTGRTAAALLSERQLHAARQLLVATDIPVQDIARHLGFGSAAYFARFVQQRCGRSPTDLRRAARRK